LILQQLLQLPIDKTFRDAIFKVNEYTAGRPNSCNTELCGHIMCCYAADLYPVTWSVGVGCW